MATIRFDDTEDLIDICMDNVFKAVFTKNNPASRSALSRLVSAIIGRDVEIIDILANEPPPDSLRDRQMRFDIHCRAADGELVDVEMSLTPDRFEPVRLEFYAGRLFVNQDIRGAKKSYKNLMRAYQIAILVKERFFPDGDFFHSFEYYDPARRVSLNGMTRILTLELSKLDNIARKPTGEMSAPELWAVYFRYLQDNSMRAKINEILTREEGIAMASEVLLDISRNEDERARLMSEYKYQLDIQSKLVDAEREGEQKIIELWKSGKPLEEVLREYGGN